MQKRNLACVLVFESKFVYECPCGGVRCCNAHPEGGTIDRPWQDCLYLTTPLCIMEFDCRPTHSLRSATEASLISLSHTTGYAILALACIGSWKGEWVQADQIHECTGVPKPYLRKLLHAMGRAGLINTKRGCQGGCVLARPPEEITLLDVVEAVESRELESNCLLGLTGCSDAHPCPVHRFWKHEWPRIEAELVQKTLADAATYVRSSRGAILTKCPDLNCDSNGEQGKKATQTSRREEARPAGKR